MDEITKEDKQILLQIINQTNFPGNTVERIVELKQKLQGDNNGLDKDRK